MSLTSFVILAAAIAAAAAQQLTVNTPTSVVHCLPVQLTWSGGQPPYYVSLLPGGQPTASPIADLGQQTGTSLSWKATIPANTPVTVQIRDSTGTLNYSDQFTVQQGSGAATCKDDSGSSPTSATTSAPAAASTGAAATNSTPSKTPAAANTTTSTTKSTTSTTPSTSAGTNNSSVGTSSTTAPASGSSAPADARNDASRTSAGAMAVAVAAVVAVFA